MSIFVMVKFHIKSTVLSFPYITWETSFFFVIDPPQLSQHIEKNCMCPQLTSYLRKVTDL